MPLTAEDSFSLNVLLAARPSAIRLEEPALRVMGLTPRGELSVALHPNCRAEKYMDEVRGLLIEHALDDAHTTLVDLKSWMRRGRVAGPHLARLLLTGEPEAVDRVARSPELVPELAQAVWWIDPSANQARAMLARAKVAESDTGRMLAEFLVEHLPFETEPGMILESVRLSLLGGQLGADDLDKLWRRGANNATYRAGYIAALPHDIPGEAAPPGGWNELRARVLPLAEAGHPLARLIARCAGPAGQKFIAAQYEALGIVNAPEAAAVLLDALADYFAEARLPDPALHAEPPASAQVESIAAWADDVCARAPRTLAALLAEPRLARMTRAALFLAWCGEPIATPVLAQIRSPGTLLRRKLAPILAPVREQLAVLLGKDGKWGAGSG
jgi:hypothetical protein